MSWSYGSLQTGRVFEEAVLEPFPLVIFDFVWEDLFVIFGFWVFWRKFESVFTYLDESTCFEMDHNIRAGLILSVSQWTNAAKNIKTKMKIFLFSFIPNIYIRYRKYIWNRGEFLWNYTNTVQRIYEGYLSSLIAIFCSHSPVSALSASLKIKINNKLKLENRNSNKSTI